MTLPAYYCEPCLIDMGDRPVIDGRRGDCQLCKQRGLVFDIAESNRKRRELRKRFKSTEPEPIPEV